MLSFGPFFIFILLFAALLFFFLRRGPVLSWPPLRYAKIFLPSWRFFEDLGYVPILEVKVGEADWLVFQRERNRPWYSLFFHPSENLQMAHQSLLFALIQDLKEEEIENLVSFQMVKNMVEQYFSIHSSYALRLSKLDDQSSEVLLHVEGLCP